MCHDGILCMCHNYLFTCDNAGGLHNGGGEGGIVLLLTREKTMAS